MDDELQKAQSNNMKPIDSECNVLLAMVQNLHFSKNEGLEGIQPAPIAGLKK